MTTYNYITNVSYCTNITTSGMPDGSYSYIEDGTSNVMVCNAAGYVVSDISYDVLTSDVLSQDVYGNFDGYGRPQQVTHLDGTTDYKEYACCGLELTTNRDGVVTQYLYDAAKRATGTEVIRGSSVMTYTNVLDPAGNVLQSIRIGSDAVAHFNGFHGL